MSIDSFLAAVADHAHPAVLPADLLEELRGHLEEAARDLQLAGWMVQESEIEAVRRFGTPAALVEALRRGGSARRSPTRHPRAALAALALTAVLLAAGSAAAAAASYNRIPEYERTVHVQAHCSGVGLHDLSRGAAVSGRPCGN